MGYHREEEQMVPLSSSEPAFNKHQAISCWSTSTLVHYGAVYYALMYVRATKLEMFHFSLLPDSMFTLSPPVFAV